MAGATFLSLPPGKEKPNNGNLFGVLLFYLEPECHPFLSVSFEEH